MVLTDSNQLLEMVNQFDDFVVDCQNNDDTEILLGIPESKLPFTIGDMEDALEFLMYEFGMEYLNTRSEDSRKKLHFCEASYLKLAECFPDDMMVFQDVLSSKNKDEKNNRLSEHMKDESDVEKFEQWSTRMMENEDKYYKRIFDIRMDANKAKTAQKNSKAK